MSNRGKITATHVDLETFARSCGCLLPGEVIVPDDDHEICIFTEDGRVVTILADMPITLGHATVKAVLVEPETVFAGRAIADNTPRQIYSLCRIYDSPPSNSI